MQARLYSAFCDLITALEKQGLAIKNIGFDWHELAGLHGSLLPVVQMLWGASGPQFRQSAFNHGYVQVCTDLLHLLPDGSGRHRGQ